MSFNTSDTPTTAASAATSKLPKLTPATSKLEKKQDLRLKHLATKHAYPVQVYLLEHYTAGDKVAVNTYHIRAGSELSFDYGLCFLCLLNSMPNYFNTRSRKSVYLNSWPLYSGDVTYPVPAPLTPLETYTDMRGCPIKAYNNLPNHDRRTTYGKNRLAFAKHVLAIITATGFTGKED